MKVNVGIFKTRDCIKSIKVCKSMFKEDMFTLETKMEKYEKQWEEKNDSKIIENIKQTRSLIMEKDVDKGLNLIQRHFNKFRLPNILTDVEKRLCLLTFNKSLSVEEVFKIKKIVKNNKINVLTLMYTDIEKYLMKKIGIKTYFHNPNIGYFKYNKYTSKWDYDNRMMTQTIKIYDKIWPKYVNVFNKLFLKVFDDDKPFDDYGNFYMEDDDYEGVKECRTMFKNLIKCGSMSSLNRIIIQAPFKNNFIPQIETDDIEQKNYYEKCVENEREDVEDKIRCLFQNHMLTRREMQTLYEFALNN